MAQTQAAQADERDEDFEPAPKRVQLPKDGKLRVFLFVHEGDLETKAALNHLDKYPDDPPDAKIATIRKVSELRLDRIRENMIIIPVVRRIDRDRSETIELNGRFRIKEHHAPIEERAPIDCSKFCRDAAAGDLEADSAIDENGLVNELGRRCTPAAPRVERRGDGKGGHTRWLTLRWG